MERVVITGVGLVTPVGIGTQESWQALLAGQSGIDLITLFDTTQFRVKIAGEVKSWDPLRFIEKKKLTLLEKGPGRISPYSIPGIIANIAAGQVSMRWGLKGPSYCVTSACS